MTYNLITYERRRLNIYNLKENGVKADSLHCEYAIFYIQCLPVFAIYFHKQ